jgi:hypothetical protein
LTDSGIRFNDYFFSEPLHLSAWNPPKCAGLCVVLAEDRNWAPKAFEPLYFGEFGNNSPASAVIEDCRPALAFAKGKALFVAVLTLPFTTTQQRCALRDELIRAYHPAYQTHAGTLPQRELAPAPPPPPRRPIGFIAT